MKARATVIAGVCLFVGTALGVGLSYFAFQRHESSSDAPTAADSQRQVLYWRDPMVPGQRFDKPGKSPFMDMHLVPVYANETGANETGTNETGADEAGGAGIKVSSSVTQSLGIRLGRAEMSSLQPSLAAVGSVAFDEHRVQLIQARVDGYVQRLRVKATLDRVRRGQVLAEVTAPQWQEALQEYAALLQSDSPRAHELSLVAHERLQVLDVPAAAIDSVARSHRVATSIAIVAPIDGVITELGLREGAAFAAGATLFRINGLESVWVNAQIPEAQVAAVPTGASVSARAMAWPGETFAGHVQALLPDVDATTRTLTVRVGVDNRQGKLSPGMFVSLDIRAAPGEQQLTVPSEAVIVTGQRTVVIEALADGGFKPVDVVSGGQVGERTRILKGLAPGQAIVLSGQFLIDSEASLTSTVERLSGDAPPATSPPP